MGGTLGLGHMLYTHDALSHEQQKSANIHILEIKKILIARYTF